MIVPQIREPGVYAIVNTITGKVYVGSASRSIYQRIHLHLVHLRKNRHHSPPLQNSWNKYGPDAFECHVLSRCAPERCLELEQFWMDELDVTDRNHGYNVCPVAGSAFGTTKSEATRKKLSDIARNRSPEVLARIRAATTTPEALAKISATHKGKVLTAETRRKISDGLKGKEQSAESRAKKSETLKKIRAESPELWAACRVGKKHTAETKAKMAEAARRRSPELRARMAAAIKASYWAKKSIPTSV